MGWEPPEIRHKCDMVRLWNRLINMPDSRLTKHIFKWDLSTGRSWTREIESVFDEAGLQHIFRNNLRCNINNVKSILFDKYKLRWSEDIWLN